MSLKSKIEAVIYASEDPVTLQQLVGLLAEEAQGELDRMATLQSELPLGDGDPGIASVQGGAALPELGEAEIAIGSAPEGAGQNGEAASPVSDALEEEPAASIAQFAAGSTEPSMGESATQLAEAAMDRTSMVHEASSPNEESARNGGSARNDESAHNEAEKRQARERERAVRDHLRRAVDTLTRDYAEGDRGIEIREVAGGFRMGTKPEYHDAVRGFVKSLKPALKLTLQALETLAVVAYKQPVTAAEISEIRGVDSSGVLGGLLTRKLIATAGRKQVIGRPMLYKTTKDFLVRFGLKDVGELPSMDEFERMAGELTEQEDLPMELSETLVERANARGDAEHVREAVNGSVGEAPPETAGDTEDLSGDNADRHDDEDVSDLSGEPGDFSGEPGDFSGEPSEAIVAQVLGVSRNEPAASEVSGGPGAAPFPAAISAQGFPGQAAGTAGEQARFAQEMREPIEAVAAMQAEQTNALAPVPPPVSGNQAGSGTKESEPQ